MTITITAEDRRQCAELRAAAREEAKKQLKRDPRVDFLTDEELQEALIYRTAEIVAHDLRILAVRDPERARRFRRAIRVLTAEARARCHRPAARGV